MRMVSAVVVSVIGSGHLKIEVTCGGIGLGQVNECI